MANDGIVFDLDHGPRLLAAATAMQRGDFRELPWLLGLAAERPQDALIQNLAGIGALAVGLHGEAVGLLTGAFELEPLPETLLTLASAVEAESGPFAAYRVIDLGYQAFPDSTEIRDYRTGIAYRLGAVGVALPGVDDLETRVERPWKREPINIGDRQIPVWQGEPVNRLFVVNDEGHGDAIQKVRYLPLARRRCAHLSLAAPKALLSLFREFADRVCADTDVALLQADAWAPLSDLEDLDLGTPARCYLPSVVPLHRGKVPKIGLCWRGNYLNTTDAVRSAPLPNLAPLARLRGVEWVSLQVGPMAAEPRPPGLQLGEAPPLPDFEATARAIDELDLVISVDTAVAHLAGAMGRPVWLAMADPNDPRWDGDPLYERMRLFRQSERGAWVPLFDKVAEEIAKQFAGRGVQLEPRRDITSTIPMFSADECDAMLAALAGEPLTDGKFRNEFAYRVSDASRYSARELRLDREHHADVYEHLWDLLRQHGTVEEGECIEILKVLVYRRGDHFIWHQDAGATPGTPERRLSLTVQLSASADYLGGDLVIVEDGAVTAAARGRGVATVFRSSAQHTVTHVLAGERIALVGWIGPQVQTP